MAASNPPARKSSSAPDATDRGVGLNHPTVVPANFDPEEDDE